MDNIEQGIAARLHVLNIIHVSILATIPIYFFASRFVSQEEIGLPTLSAEKQNILYYILLITGASLFFGIRIIKKFIMQKGLSPSVIGASPSPDMLANKILAQYASSVIASLILSELIILCGFIIYFLDDPMMFYVLIGAGAVSMISNGPRKDEINRYLKQCNILVVDEKGIGKAKTQIKGKKISWIMAVLPLIIVGIALYFVFGGSIQQKRILKIGLPAKALLLDIKPTGTIVNDQPMVKMHMEVKADGLKKYETDLKMVISPVYLPQFQPGVVLNIKYNPDNPKEVAIESIEKKDWQNQRPTWPEDF